LNEKIQVGIDHGGRKKTLGEGEKADTPSKRNVEKSGDNETQQRGKVQERGGGEPYGSINREKERNIKKRCEVAS